MLLLLFSRKQQQRQPSGIRQQPNNHADEAFHNSAIESSMPHHDDDNAVSRRKLCMFDGRSTSEGVEHATHQALYLKLTWKREFSTLQICFQHDSEITRKVFQVSLSLLCLNQVKLM